MNQQAMDSGFNDSGQARTQLRLFFALWPPQKAVAEIMEWARAAHDICGGRMMRPETIHLTLAFLGNTPLDKAMALAEAARQWPVSFGPITLREFGRFIGPRVVWAGPSPDSEEVLWLTRLHDALWTRLEAMGWQRPESAFRPHVSLLRKAGPGDISALTREPIVWTPRHCVLVASMPQEGGSHYRVLATLPAAPS